MQLYTNTKDYKWIVYWLIPKKTEYPTYKKILEELASKYNGAIFEPHVTLYYEDLDKDVNYTERFNQIKNSLSPFSMEYDKVYCGEGISQTLCMGLKQNNIFTKNQNYARDSSVTEKKEMPKPHLSLMYGDLKKEEKEELLSTLPDKLPKEVTLSELWAILVSTPHKSKEDSDGWRLFARSEI